MIVTDRRIRIVKKCLKLLFAFSLADEEHNVAPNWAQAPRKLLIVHPDFAAVVLFEEGYAGSESMNVVFSADGIELQSFAEIG